MSYEIDLVLLTEDRYVNPQPDSEYLQNILLEDAILIEAFSKHSLKIIRKSWSDSEFDWNKTKFILFRTTWDYFDRYNTFYLWLNQDAVKSKCINVFDTILWNLDKHYLRDLELKNIPIVETFFAEKKCLKSLKEICLENHWDQIILKPAISGAARHTYKIAKDEIIDFELLFRSLVEKEAMLIQPFQNNILTKGELTLVLINGKYTHAVLKKAKHGDFRVQDDFGGTFETYFPDPKEIAFAESVLKCISPIPLYARVDLIWNNKNRLVISELELIEPELWFRLNKHAAQLLADAIAHLF